MTKIIFICGSLEPGRDGVGDYTRRLGGELIKQGYQVGLVAIHDPNLSDEFDSLQEINGVMIPVLRLPPHLAYNERFKRAGVWINNFNPDWLSLQFVPFSFHSKGLPFRLGKILSSLGKNRNWHIMMHELWVGMDTGASIKAIYWGWLQKQLIKSLLKKLKPIVIHTQTSLYMKMLAKIGFKPQYLPLFGNISLGSEVVDRISSEQGLISGKVKQRSFVLFGGIHFGAPVELFAKDIADYCKENDIQVMLTIIGRCGSEQDRWAKVWKSIGLPVQILGEQQPKRIADEFRKAHLGIATTPSALIDKSGSVAAMLEFGLPVLCVSRSWHPRGILKTELPYGIMEYIPGNQKNLFSVYKTKRDPTHVEVIAHQFMNNLLTSL